LPLRLSPLDIADNDANKLEYRIKKSKKEVVMAGSIYKIIEIVGTSEKSWEDAAKTAIETAGKTLEDLRVAEVVKQDVTVEKGKVTSYRIRLNISFKYHVEK
jgi:flavin-binding protein dodecin